MQVHSIDALEILLFGIVEIFLCSGYACARHHIYEAAGMFVNETNAFFACLRGDEHYYAYVVFVGNGFECLHIVLEREVWYYSPADVALHTTFAELLYAILHYDVEITHKYKRYLHFIFYRFQLSEELAQCHSIT